MTVFIPLIKANPPRLSRHLGALETLETSGIFSNNGPLVKRFEAEATQQLFGGVGGCVTVANATLGLMLALRLVAENSGTRNGLALMPSFTFAAQAQAALWAGLTPLLCDIDPGHWAASERAEERKLKQYGGRITAVVPYATFGNSIDLDRYAWLAKKYEVEVVVDAASSLGSRDAVGRGFGTGSRFMIVFSMQATKAFATAEGGLIYSADPDRCQALRTMANFGFGDPRSATMPGMNAKMSEICALLALEKLRDIDAVIEWRAALAARYESRLPDFGFQQPLGQRQAMQSMSLLLPKHLAASRSKIVEALAAHGIGAATYFSPHLAEQPYFRKHAIMGRLPHTTDVAARVLVLPLADTMTFEEVDAVCETLTEICSSLVLVKSGAKGAGVPHRRVHARQTHIGA